MIPYGDCPLDDDKVGEMVYMDILNRAVDYVHIMTPYLILDGELETALKYAAQRGVDVKLILPGIPDKKMVYALAKAHYKRLIDAGVKIYEYTPGFVHAKIFVSDDVKAVVGTINLDYRSLYHHFECAAYLYKAACIADIERDFEETLQKCREVTPQTIREETLYNKIMGRVMQIIAPMLSDKWGQALQTFCEQRSWVSHGDRFLDSHACASQGTCPHDSPMNAVHRMFGGPDPTKKDGGVQ